jgi:hypothetical protein
MAALAQAVGGKTEAAYNRTPLVAARSWTDGSITSTAHSRVARLSDLEHGVLPELAWPSLVRYGKRQVPMKRPGTIGPLDTAKGSEVCYESNAAMRP